MKLFFTFCFIAIVSIAHAQTTAAIATDGIMPDILVGEHVKLSIKVVPPDKPESAVIITALKEKRFELVLDKTTISNYTIAESAIAGSFKIEFDCPKDAGLPGKDKIITLKNNGNEWSEKVNIYANAPVVKDIYPGIINTAGDRVLFNDMLEDQEIVIKVDNSAYVEKITFSDARVKIKGTETNSILYSNTDFKVNHAENLIAIKAKLRDVTSLKLTLSYISKPSFTEQNAADVEPADVRLDKKYPGGIFSVQPNKFYADDFFEQGYKPSVRSDMKPDGVVNTNYKFSITGINPVSAAVDLKIKGTLSSSATLQRSGIELELPNQLVAGTYEISATPLSGSGNTLKSELIILPEPKIDKVSVANSTTTELVRKMGNNYTLNIKGAKLEAMPEVKIELVSKDPTFSKTYVLAKDGGYQRDGVSATINFRTGDADLIRTGDYLVRLSRVVNDPVNPHKYEGENYIKVSYPKLIDTNQIKLVGLANALFVDDKELRAKQRPGANKNMLFVLKPESPLFLKIKPSPAINEKGPQYLDVQAVYYKYDGSTSTVQWAEGTSKSMLISDHDVVYDLKTAFSIKENLGINEKIFVTVKHSPEIYGLANESVPVTYKYYRQVAFLDRFGVTASIPPYLITGRTVARKTVTKDAAGAVTDVKYDGSKLFEVQSLVINAGLGLKYRFKKDNYENSNIAIATYLMGLNFAASKSRAAQINDPDNYDIIGNGSFNLLVVGEYSLVNLDDLNARIPVYLGSAVIFKPLDEGKKLAPVFGLGIEIKIH